MSFLAKCVRFFYNLLNTPKNAKEVEEFYKDVKYPAALTKKLSALGFKYKGELNSLDWNKTPGESLASKIKKINCGDFLELFCGLYKKLNITYDVYLLESKGDWFWQYKWHYVSVITWKQRRLMQSNNTLSYIDSEDDILARFNGEFTSIKKL